MKHTLLLLMLAATPLAAQTPAIPEGKKPVATINGESVTADMLDHLYGRLNSEMRQNYDKNGGKGALLDNYIRKRLVIQEAMKKGFDKRPDVQADLEAARESALFDRYIRDVVAQSIVTDAIMQKHYDENLKDFAVPETIKVRHIVIAPSTTGFRPHTPEQAFELIKTVMGEVRSALAEVRSTDPIAAIQASTMRFAALARQYSEDGVASTGGDLGWVGRGQLDSDFEQAAFALKAGTASGIVQTRYGYHIIYVEGKRPAGTLSFDEAKPRIREILTNQHAADIMNAVSKLTNELTNSSKISVYPENIR